MLFFSNDFYIKKYLMSLRHVFTDRSSFIFVLLWGRLTVRLLSLEVLQVGDKYLIILVLSYMSAHVLLNLLDELGKSDKMRGLQSILSLFHNDLIKFNNTRAWMLDSIYHMTNTLKSHTWRKNVIILPLCTQRWYGRHNFSC